MSKVIRFKKPEPTPPDLLWAKELTDHQDTKEFKQFANSTKAIAKQRFDKKKKAKENN